MQKPTLIDLFSGAGGISHGFEQAGFSVIAGVDLDHDSLLTFKANHAGSRVLKADLAKLQPSELASILGIKPGQIDCIVGGPPCQGFSKNRAGRHQNGIYVDDPRNYLFARFLGYIAYFQPKIVLMENVPEMLAKLNGSFRSAVFESFSDMGYSIDAKILNAAEYGVPQQRRRAFYIAGREGQKVAFPQPTSKVGPKAGRRTPTSPEYPHVTDSSQSMLPIFDFLSTGVSVWDAIGDLSGRYAESLNDCCDYANEPCSNYQLQRRSEMKLVRNHFPWQLSERQIQRISLLNQGEGYLHLPPELQVKSGYGSAYRRLQSDAQALTITTWMFHPGSGMFTHPFENRVITIREAARLQSYQDSFVFYGSYHSQCRQVGNSVAPLVAKSIAQAILPVIS